MENKKLAAMVLLIALALSTFGFAYAHWSDMVYIEGTVEMGSLALAFDYVEPPSCVEYYWANGKKVEGEYLGKEVGDSDCHYEDYIKDVHTLKEGYKKLIIEITNAYPQYIVHTTFKLHNIGTIPIDIATYEITGEKRDSEGTVICNLLYADTDPAKPWIGDLWEDVDGDGIIDLAVDLKVIDLEITNQLPKQIDPCDTDKAEIDLEFKQDAEECHTYTIHVTVVGIQWNKELP